jgi:hypothetical protein
MRFRRRLGPPEAFKIEIIVVGPKMIGQPGEVFLLSRREDGRHRLRVPLRRATGRTAVATPAEREPE